MTAKRSVLKTLKGVEKRKAYNKAIKSKVKTETTKVLNLLQENKADDAKKALISTISEIDKATKKGVLHKNTASRKKSRLTLRVNAAK